ncbi:GmrSD restriction endonuclease domain-containing protein [Thalassotalea agariperforans]
MTTSELFNGDEELFETERNRLGGILLLKGRDNISSNNEVFSQKLKTYGNSLYWNETLREDCYKSKLDFTSYIAKHELPFSHYSKFGPDELEARHQLLFEISKSIWA